MFSVPGSLCQVIYTRLSVSFAVYQVLCFGCLPAVEKGTKNCAHGKFFGPTFFVMALACQMQTDALDLTLFTMSV